MNGEWRCRRVDPPCVGHRRPGLSCANADVAALEREPSRAGDVPGSHAPRARTLSVGVNLPWSFTYCGYDFGIPPRGWRARHPSPRRWEEEIGATLDAIAKVGLDVVRFWILADGVAYPEREPITRWARLARDPATKRVHVALRDEPPQPALLSEALVEDVRSFLDALHVRGLRAIPSFLSFETFAPGRLVADGTLKQGRAELWLGKGARGDVAWIDGVLDATLVRLLAIPGPRGEAAHPAIHAWEAVNEPEWAVKHGYVGVTAMSVFLERAIEAIVRKGHRATVGFADDSMRSITPALRTRLFDLAKQGRYVHQLHHYPRLGTRELGAAEATTIPGSTIVGELAMSDAPRARWRDSTMRESELDPARYLASRLERVESLDYSLALLWSVNAGDDKSGWDAEVREQVRAFTSRPLRRP